jgi:hypothetical protein
MALTSRPRLFEYSGGLVVAGGVWRSSRMGAGSSFPFGTVKTLAGPQVEVPPFPKTWGLS